MKMLRAATLTVADLDRSVSLYQDWLDYTAVETGTLSAELCESWAAPASAGKRYSVLQPSAGTDIYLRFVEDAPVPGYLPLRTYGWAATEICVQDVLAVNERMERSPFEIIGPPRKIEGLDAIHPMQVKGPDGEIVYLTQINDDLPAYDLPRAQSLIDCVFIMVLACSDMQASLDWFETALGLQKGRQMDIVYTMIAQAFDLPEDQLHTIATLIDERDVFLETDQYPDAAIPRPAHEGALPPGVGLVTLKTTRFDDTKGEWITAPVTREGAVYQGKRAGTLRAPDNTLVELVEA